MTSLASTHGTQSSTRRKGGRPHKGNRHLFQSRVPQPLAELVMEQAAAAGLTINDYLASVIADAHDYPLPVNRTGSDNSVQEEFAMQTAS
jgi:predicted HicB family RNase H-like nuclease